MRSPPGLRKAICERVAGEGVFRTSPDLLSSRAAYSNIWVPVTRSTRSSRSPSWVGPALTHFHYSLSVAFCFSRFVKTSSGSRVPSTIYCRLGWPFLAGRCRARWSRARFALRPLVPRGSRALSRSGSWTCRLSSSSTWGAAGTRMPALLAQYSVLRLILSLCGS